MSFNAKQTIVSFLIATGEARSAFYARMVKGGLGDWGDASQVCIEAVAETAKCKLVKKERGEGFTLDVTHRNYNTAKGQLDYLRVIWKGQGDARAVRANKTDPVESLVKKFSALTGAEKRRFLKAIEAA